jgi:hypothetical protein
METKLIPIAARHLLEIDRERTRMQGGPERFLPPLVTVALLFFNASFEDLLRTDADRHYLDLFLFLQGSFCIVLALTYYVGRSEEIVVKSRLLPSSAWSRFFFVCFSNLRRPASLAFWGTNVLTLMVIYHRSPGALAPIAVLFTLFLLDLQAAGGLLFLLFTRTEHPIAGLAIVLLAGIFGLLLSVLVFHFGSLMTALLPVNWTAAGVQAVLNGDSPDLLLNAGLLGGLFIAVLAAGKRYA